MENKPRNPWIAGFFTILSIGLGHVYAGNIKRGIILFFIFKIFAEISTLVLMIPIDYLALYLSHIIFYASYLYLIIDAVKLAKESRYSYELKKYNKWYIYLIFFIITSIVLQQKLEDMHCANISVSMSVDVNVMEPAVLFGDLIAINKIIYNFSDPARGDIVIVPSSKDPSKDTLRRVVGLGGDTVEVIDREIFINGSEYWENYNIIPQEDTAKYSFDPVEVPHDSVLVLPDNRNYINLNIIRKSRIKGKVICVYWSKDKENSDIRWKRIGRRVR